MCSRVQASVYALEASSLASSEVPRGRQPDAEDETAEAEQRGVRVMDAFEILYKLKKDVAHEPCGQASPAH